MRQRRRAAVSVCAIALLCYGHMQTALADNCRGTIPGDSIRSSGYVGTDGKVHYTLAYASGVTSEQIDAFHDAINYWNTWSGTSGIVLEDSGGSGGDFVVKAVAGISTCAEYVPGASIIRYEPSSMAFASFDRPMAAFIYAHELGHALGIDHHGGWSVMNEPQWPGDCYHEAQTQAPQTVQESDASDARGCAFAAHQGLTYGPPPAYVWQQDFTTCSVWYYTEEHYTCDSDGGCSLAYTVDTVIASTCD